MGEGKGDGRKEGLERVDEGKHTNRRIGVACESFLRTIQYYTYTT